MALSRWDPLAGFETVRDMMDELVGRTMAAPSRFLGRERVFPVDLYETDSEVVVKASLPGVKPEDIDVHVVGNILTIRGEAKVDETVQRESYLLQERRYGAFSRTLTLPAPVSAEKARALFEHGVLTLTLPKSEAAKPKHIPIQTQQPVGGSQ